MKQPDFNAIPVYHCEITDGDKNIFSCKRQNHPLLPEAYGNPRKDFRNTAS